MWITSKSIHQIRLGVRNTTIAIKFNNWNKSDSSGFPVIKLWDVGGNRNAIWQRKMVLASCSNEPQIWESPSWWGWQWQRPDSLYISEESCYFQNWTPEFSVCNSCVETTLYMFVPTKNLIGQVTESPVFFSKINAMLRAEARHAVSNILQTLSI